MKIRQDGCCLRPQYSPLLASYMKACRAVMVRNRAKIQTKNILLPFLQFRRAFREIRGVYFKTIKPEVRQSLDKTLKHFARIKTAIYENFLPQTGLCIFTNLRCSPHNNAVKMQPGVMVCAYISERPERFPHDARRMFIGLPQFL